MPKRMNMQCVEATELTTTECERIASSRSGRSRRLKIVEMTDPIVTIGEQGPVPDDLPEEHFDSMHVELALFGTAAVEAAFEEFRLAANKFFLSAAGSRRGGRTLAAPRPRVRHRRASHTLGEPGGEPSRFRHRRCLARLLHPGQEALAPKHSEITIRPNGGQGVLPMHKKPRRGRPLLRRPCPLRATLRQRGSVKQLARGLGAHSSLRLPVRDVNERAATLKGPRSGVGTEPSVSARLELRSRLRPSRAVTANDFSPRSRKAPNLN